MSFTTIVRPRARVHAAASRGAPTTVRPSGTLHLKGMTAKLQAPASAEA